MKELEEAIEQAILKWHDKPSFDENDKRIPKNIIIVRAVYEWIEREGYVKMPSRIAPLWMN